VVTLLSLCTRIRPFSLFCGIKEIEHHLKVTGSNPTLGSAAIEGHVNTEKQKSSPSSGPSMGTWAKGVD